MFDCTTESYDVCVTNPTAPHPVVNVRVINLESSPQRCQSMQEQLVDQGIPGKRFPAVDGLHITVEDNSTHKLLRGAEMKDHPEFFMPKHVYTINCYPADPTKSAISFIYQAPARPHPTAGEFGASCSHRSVWHEAAASNTPRTLVLEDDVTLKPEFWPNTLQAYANLNATHDILYHFVLSAIGSQKPEDFGIVERYSGELVGAQAYTITPQGAKKLLQITNRMYTEAIDLDVTRKRFRLYVYKTRRHELTTSLAPELSDIHKRGRVH